MNETTYIPEKPAGIPAFMKEGDWIDEDGLIRCRVCGQRKQKHQELLSRMRTVRINCSCERQAHQAEEQRRQAIEARDRIAAMKTTCIHDRKLLDCTFANDDGTLKQLESAHRYVNSWQEQREKNCGLLLWGGVGTGKTFYAACIANALIDQGVPVLMTNFSRILNSLGSLHSEQRNSFLAGLNRYELLIIDDLGVERSSEYVLEQLYHVIDERYKARLPLIITTNLQLRSLRTETDPDRLRIYDRILAMCVPIAFIGTSRRRGIAERKYKAASALFAPKLPN